MASITVSHNGETHEGDDIAAIARKVWGPTAKVQRVLDNGTLGEGIWQADIVKRSGQIGVSQVICRVVVREN